MILQSARDDLGGRGGIAIDEDDDWELRALFAASRAVDLIREGATALRNDDLALLKELVGGVDGFVEKTAWVASEVEDETVDLAEVIERVAYFMACCFDEAGHVDIADAGADEEGEIDGRPRECGYPACRAVAALRL